MIAVEIAKKPAPAKKRPNWRRDRCEKKADCASAVEEVCESAAGCRSGIVAIWRKAIGGMDFCEGDRDNIITMQKLNACLISRSGCC